MTSSMVVDSCLRMFLNTDTKLLHHRLKLLRRWIFMSPLSTILHNFYPLPLDCFRNNRDGLASNLFCERAISFFLVMAIDSHCVPAKCLEFFSHILWIHRPIAGMVLIHNAVEII